LKLCIQEEFSTPHRSPKQCVVMNRIPRPPQIPSTQHRIRGLPEIKSKEECCKKIAVGREGEGNVHYSIWSVEMICILDGRDCVVCLRMRVWSDGRGWRHQIRNA